MTSFKMFVESFDVKGWVLRILDDVIGSDLNHHVDSTPGNSSHPEVAVAKLKEALESYYDDFHKSVAPAVAELRQFVDDHDLDGGDRCNFSLISHLMGDVNDVLITIPSHLFGKFQQKYPQHVSGNYGKTYLTNFQYMALAIENSHRSYASNYWRANDSFLPVLNQPTRNFHKNEQLDEYGRLFQKMFDKLKEIGEFMEWLAKAIREHVLAGN